MNNEWGFLGMVNNGRRIFIFLLNSERKVNSFLYSFIFGRQPKHSTNWLSTADNHTIYKKKAYVKSLSKTWNEAKFGKPIFLNSLSMKVYCSSFGSLIMFIVDIKFLPN